MPAASGAEPAIELEPKAINLLKAASGRLAAARTMSFTAVVTYDSPSRLGHRLEYTTKSEVTLQRPAWCPFPDPASKPTLVLPKSSCVCS